MHQNFFKEVENSAPSYGNENSTSVAVCGVLVVGTELILMSFWSATMSADDILS